MAALTIRNVDDALKTQLRIRAAQHGVSMEEEARRILRDALARAGTGAQPMGQRLLSRFNTAASTDFTPPERHLPRTAPEWTEGKS
ncbi:plasmid stabilization protein [Curvibacter sp. CHRR-16]|uniref:FitA-like ribbon-helix-helix domain-containing protein n=1 Tax=Curvibacter sp. CHRR-16 TaxID=2835872 RepID=UPI002023B3DF|nr:plasmid stabilization protein [Curvibacter sp. CHRR-16]